MNSWYYLLEFIDSITDFDFSRVLSLFMIIPFSKYTLFIHVLACKLILEQLQSYKGKASTLDFSLSKISQGNGNYTSPLCKLKLMNKITCSFTAINGESLLSYSCQEARAHYSFSFLLFEYINIMLIFVLLRLNQVTIRLYNGEIAKKRHSPIRVTI